MSHIRDLVRTLRSQPQRLDAQTASAMLERARAEGVSPAEMQELTALLESELRDKFSPQLRESLTRFIEGGAGGEGARPVHELLPDLERISDAEDVPKRFAADLVLLRDQLIASPKLPAAEKAERLFEFMLAYAERFVALASGEAKVAPKPQAAEVLSGGLVAKDDRAERAVGKNASAEARAPEPMPRARRDEQVRAFAKVLKEGGFDQLHDPRTGRDGVKVALHLLASPSVSELRRRSDAVRLESAAFQRQEQEQAQHSEPVRARSATGAVPTAPARDLGESGALKDRGKHEAERVGASKLDPMKVQPWQVEAGKVVVLPVRTEAENRSAAGEAQSSKRGTNKVLGRNMLWNWLHTFREGGGDEAERRHNLERLTFGAVALLIAAALVAIVLVAVG